MLFCVKSIIRKILSAGQNLHSVELLLNYKQVKCLREIPEALNLLWREQVCKPSSVFDNHLSRRTVTGTLKRPTYREATGNRLSGIMPRRAITSLLGLAPGGVCTANMLPYCRWALTSPFQPYLSLVLSNPKKFTSAFLFSQLLLCNNI